MPAELNSPQHTHTHTHTHTETQVPTDVHAGCSLQSPIAVVSSSVLEEKKLKKRTESKVHVLYYIA